MFLDFIVLMALDPPQYERLELAILPDLFTYISVIERSIANSIIVGNVGHAYAQGYLDGNGCVGIGCYLDCSDPEKRRERKAKARMLAHELGQTLGITLDYDPIVIMPYRPLQHQTDPAQT